MVILFRVTLLLLLCIFAFIFTVDTAFCSGSKPFGLVVDGMERRYFVYFPENCKEKNLPLMMVLHGGMGNAVSIEKRTGMDEVADSGPFIVVYPDGVGGHKEMKNRRTWNAGDCCGIAARRNINDVRFLEQVIDQVEVNYPVDKRRVYVVGMSNGGMMAYRLASEIPHKIAAVIAISAELAVDNFDAAKDVPVLHIHGTNDRFVPMAGGVGTRSLTNVVHRSLDETVKRITRARQSKSPEVKMVAGSVQSSLYHCSQGAPVEVVRIQGGAHAWPGGRGHRDQSGAGRHFSASKYVWEFARKFSLTTK
jgi:polyhydroxybutyrate depolymerase